MERNTLVREALKSYARVQMHHPDNTMSPRQWLSLLNCYIRRRRVEECAEEAEISEVQAAMWYTHLALAVTSYAIRLTRAKYQS